MLTWTRINDNKVTLSTLTMIKKRVPAQLNLEDQTRYRKRHSKAFHSFSQEHHLDRHLRSLPPGVNLVGGKLPDRWNDYKPYNQYFPILKFKFKGVLPCKTFLDQCFDDRVVESHELETLGFWHLSSLFEVESFPEVSRKDSKVCVVSSTTKLRSKSETVRASADSSSEDVNGARCPAWRTEKFTTSCVGAVVNLCLTERHYSVSELRNSGVDYFRLKVDGGGIIPPSRVLFSFIELFGYISNKTPADKLVALHCTHGVNRTGFFSVVLLIIFGGYSYEEATEIFKQARGHPIDREELLKGLLDLQKNFFSDQKFIKYLDEVSRIYLLKPRNSFNHATLFLHRVPSVIEPCDIVCALLDAHYLRNSLLYTPLGLLNVARISNYSGRYGKLASDNPELLCNNAESFAGELTLSEIELTDENPIELVFVNESYAKDFEKLWPEVSLSSCVRNSALPLSYIHNQRKLEESVVNIKLSESLAP